MDKKALARYSPEIQRLYKEGIFKPFEPSSIFRDRKAFRRFDTELRAAIKLGSFWLGNPSELTAACNVPIYRDKLTHSMFHELARLGLAKKSTSGLLYLFERQTARVYMALLAKHIADSSNEPTIVGTDSEEMSNFVLGAAAPSTPKNIVLSAEFDELIPVPSPGTSLSKILRFRSKHEAELLAFRSAMDAFDSELAKCEDPKEVRAKLQSQKEKIRKGTIELSKAMKANSVGTFLGNLQSFIKPNSPTLLGAAAVAAGKVASLATLPVGWVAGGAAVAGSIEVGVHWFGKVQERKKTLKDSPFAYLFLAQKKLV